MAFVQNEIETKLKLNHFLEVRKKQNTRLKYEGAFWSIYCTAERPKFGPHILDSAVKMRHPW